MWSGRGSNVCVPPALVSTPHQSKREAKEKKKRGKREPKETEAMKILECGGVVVAVLKVEVSFVVGSCCGKIKKITK